MVGPASFFAEDWDTYDLDKNNEAAAGLFGVMLGSEIDKDKIGTDELQEIMKPISAYAWVNENYNCWCNSSCCDKCSTKDLRNDNSCKIPIGGYCTCRLCGVRMKKE